MIDVLWDLVIASLMCVASCDFPSNFLLDVPHDG